MTDRRQLHGYTISSCVPCEPNGSGELKNRFSHDVAHMSQLIIKLALSHYANDKIWAV